MAKPPRSFAKGPNIAFVLPTNFDDFRRWLASVVAQQPDLRIGVREGRFTNFRVASSTNNPGVIEVRALDYIYDLESETWVRGEGPDGLQSAYALASFDCRMTQGASGRLGSIEVSATCPAAEGPPRGADRVKSTARSFFRQLVTAIAAEWPQSGYTRLGFPRKPPGRKRIKANAWAREQIDQGRSPASVYPDWVERYSAERGKEQFEMLVNPMKTFQAAITVPNRK